MIKKMTNVLVLVSVLALSVAATACSSAKKNVEEAPAAEVSKTVDAPVNLGASTGGRGL